MAAAVSFNFCEAKIDVNDCEDDIKKFIHSIPFKSAKSLNKHFKKHKTDYKLKDIATKDQYLDSARENIINSLFKKGFILKTANPNSLAFFATQEDGFPDFLTIVHYEERSPELITFYPANQKTISLVAKSFQWMNFTYMAKFEKGISEKGWEAYSCRSTGWGYEFDPIESVEGPSKPVAQEIDILVSKIFKQ